MTERFVNACGVVVEVVPARVCMTQGPSGRSGAAVLACTVSAALMRSAGTHVRAMLAGVVHDGSEVCMLLLRSGGELAVLVFDVTGSDAQCWLQLGRARGRLELAMSDGTTTKVVRCDLGQDVGSALARSTHRRMAEPTDFAVAIRSLIAWLGTPDSLAVLGFDPRAGSSPVVVNLYAEPWVAQRRTAVRESQEP